MKIVQQVNEQVMSIRHCEQDMFQFGEWTGKKLIANYFVFCSPEQIYVGPVGQEVWRWERWYTLLQSVKTMPQSRLVPSRHLRNF